MSHLSPDPEERESVPPALAALFAALDEPGALAAHDQAAARAQVRAALDQTLGNTLRDAVGDAVGKRRRRPSRRPPQVWLIAALVLGAGGVLAAVGQQYWRASGAPDAAKPPRETATSRPGETIAKGTSGVHAAPPKPDVAAAGSTPAAVTTPTVETEKLGAPADSEKAPAPAYKTSPDLLAEANRSRRAGQTAEAVRLYLRVVTQSPASESAYVARVAAGQLLLTASPTRALSLFREAHESRPNGPLEREIQLGIARASKAAPRK